MKNTGLEFLEKTKYKNLEESDQSKKLPQPPLELEYSDELKFIELPPIDSIKINNVSLRDAIDQRSSERVYSNEKLKLEELTYLLWCTQGVKGINQAGNRVRKSVPSAGARHAFETYLLVNNVEGIEKGLYRYISLENKLILINSDEDISTKITEGCYNQKFVFTSAVTFIWTAVPYRMTWRYVERGYRYLFLDAGHVCQNLYLAGEDVNCGVCAIAAYDDDKLNSVLGIDGEKEFAIYIGTVGKR